MLQLMNAVTSNSDSSTGPVFDGSKDKVVVIAGTWDTATVTLKASPDGGTTWVDIEDGAFTADVIKRIVLCSGMSIKGTVSSVGASTSLSMWIGE